MMDREENYKKGKEGIGKACQPLTHLRSLTVISFPFICLTVHSLPSFTIPSPSSTAECNSWRGEGEDKGEKGGRRNRVPGLSVKRGNMWTKQALKARTSRKGNEETGELPVNENRNEETGEKRRLGSPLSLSLPSSPFGSDLGLLFSSLSSLYLSHLIISVSGRGKKEMACPFPSLPIHLSLRACLRSWIGEV